MSPLDFDQARHEAAGTAAVVRSLANETRRLASVENNSHSELACLAVLSESLAEQAQTAAEAIDSCLRSASHTMQDPRSVALSLPALELCTKSDRHATEDSRYGSQHLRRRLRKARRPRRACRGTARHPIPTPRPPHHSHDLGDADVRTVVRRSRDGFER